MLRTLPLVADDPQNHVERIVDRLRRDHPDPAMREELYANGGLTDYVRVLMNGVEADDEEIARIADAVRDAEDGTPGPS